MIHFVAMVMSGSPKAVQIKNKQIKGNSYVSYNLINILQKTCWLLDLLQYVYSYVYAWVETLLQVSDTQRLLT